MNARPSRRTEDPSGSSPPRTTAAAAGWEVGGRSWRWPRFVLRHFVPWDGQPIRDHVAQQRLDVGAAAVDVDAGQELDVNLGSVAPLDERGHNHLRMTPPAGLAFLRARVYCFV